MFGIVQRDLDMHEQQFFIKRILKKLRQRILLIALNVLMMIEELLVFLGEIIHYLISTFQIDEIERIELRCFDINSISMKSTLSMQQN
jgi:hypothetical protein